jgi:Methylase involved in ubiquinone/menaquinone biosynthesis
MSEEQSIEKLVSDAFNRQAPVFDELYIPNGIIKYKRRRVREHLDQLINKGSSILELNCGTGEDAIYFAEKGHNIHATDLSLQMLSILENKIEKKGFQKQITTENISFHDLSNISGKGPYDLIFSNFGGLNCTDKLNEVLASFDPLLKPGAYVCLVIISKFCLWEFLLMFKGKFKTAFRRLFASKGRKAHIEGSFFKCWYYSPSYVIKNMKNYQLVSVEGLCTLVPPSYIELFTEKHPLLFEYLKNKEGKWKSSWPWRSIGDYFIITFKKK